jgi:putative zinc finger/helix-turn-helix YgiT family protein
MSLSSLEGSLHRGCGGRYAQHEEQVTVRLSGMAAEVTRAFFRCEKCGHEQRTIEQRDAAEKAAVDQIRVRHGLLTPREIRQLREELGLTSPQLADVCYGTPRGIVAGWEKGRYLQNREADALLRSLRDPEVFAFRTARAGVVPAGVAAGVPSDAALGGPAGDAAADAGAANESTHAAAPTAEGAFGASYGDTPAP